MANPKDKADIVLLQRKAPKQALNAVQSLNSLPLHTLQVREPGADYTADPPDPEDKHTKEDKPTEADPVTMATNLTDQMDNLHALNSYFYIAIEGLMKDVEILDEEVLWGLWLNMRWLHERSEAARSAAKDLHGALREAWKASTDQEEESLE